MYGAPGRRAAPRPMVQKKMKMTARRMMPKKRRRKKKLKLKIKMQTEEEKARHAIGLRQRVSKAVAAAIALRPESVFKARESRD